MWGCTGHRLLLCLFCPPPPPPPLFFFFFFFFLNNKPCLWSVVLFVSLLFSGIGGVQVNYLFLVLVYVWGFILLVFLLFCLFVCLFVFPGSVCRILWKCFLCWMFVSHSNCDSKIVGLSLLLLYSRLEWRRWIYFIFIIIKCWLSNPL